MLLSECGVATYKVEYLALIKRIHEHFVPKQSVIVQRFKFNTCVRQAGKSVSMFVAHLRALSEHCEFGNTLEDMLRDCLIYGIADSQMQHAMLAEPNLKFAKAFELTQTMESADHNTHKLQSNTPMHLLTDQSTQQRNPATIVEDDITLHHVILWTLSQTKTGGTKRYTSTLTSQPPVIHTV